MPISSGFSVDNILSSPPASSLIASRPESGLDFSVKTTDSAVLLHSLFSSLPLCKELIGSPSSANGSLAPQQSSADTLGEPDNGQCAADRDHPPPPTTITLTNDLFSQWAMHCVRIFGKEKNDGEEGEGTSRQSGTVANPMFLNPPLSLSTGNGFPLFQQMQKTKRVRTAFSPGQLIQLEKAFCRSQYLVGSDRKQLAKQLALSETQVKVWFQNRRTKSKRVDIFTGGSAAEEITPFGGESELMKRISQDETEGGGSKNGGERPKRKVAKQMCANGVDH